MVAYFIYLVNTSFLWIGKKVKIPKKTHPSRIRITFWRRNTFCWNIGILIN